MSLSLVSVTCVKCWQVYFRACSAKRVAPRTRAHWYTPTQLEGSMWASMWLSHNLHHNKHMSFFFFSTSSVVLSAQVTLGVTL